VERALPRNMLATLLTRNCKLYPSPLNNYQSGYQPEGKEFILQTGPIIQQTNPAWINMSTACYGEGNGGTTDPNAFREYAPGMGQIYSLENIANSTYNAFQVAVRRTQGPLF